MLVHIDRYAHKGVDILIDEDDLHFLIGHSATVDQNGYVSVTIDGKKHRLHRLIMGLPAGKEVDHIDGNVYDNRKCNLRLATPSQNRINGVKHQIPRLTSIYKGVNFSNGNRKKPWCARIGKDGKDYNLGYYSTEEEAARAYDAKAVELFGEYARLNLQG